MPVMVLPDQHAATCSLLAVKDSSNLAECQILSVVLADSGCCNAGCDEGLSDSQEQQQPG